MYFFKVTLLKKKEICTLKKNQHYRKFRKQRKKVKVTPNSSPKDNKYYHSPKCFSIPLNNFTEMKSHYTCCHVPYVNCFPPLV